MQNLTVLGIEAPQLTQNFRAAEAGVGGSVAVDGGARVGAAGATGGIVGGSRLRSLVAPSVPIIPAAAPATAASAVVSTGVTVSV